jgi:tryptophan 2,3-dioxygenase
MECCCYGIVAEVIAAIEWIKTRDFEDAARALHEAAELAEVLFPLFCAVQTIRADRFFDFRAATGNASAIQSRMYQLMQIYVQGLDEAKAPVMAHLPEVADLLLLGDRRFRTLPRALVDLDRVGGAPEAIVDGARQLDRALYRWRSLHVAIARDYLSGHSAGPGLRGTGATSGVPYLQAHSYRRVFPLSERDEPPAATPAFPRTPFAPLFGPAN